VKPRSTARSAECYHPAVTSKLIEEAAERAAKWLAAKKVPAPFKLEAPITMVVDFVQAEMADKAMIMPGAKRLEDRKVEYVANDMATI
jgi:D-aminopeptidase